MHYQRLISSSRLSEYFGPSTIPIDETLKLLRIERTSLKIWEGISEEVKEYLIAYSQGINDQFKKTWVSPIEFWVTGSHFEEWKPVHCVMLIKMM